MGRDPLKGEQGCPRQSDPGGPVKRFLQPIPGGLMKGTIGVHRVQQDIRVDDHSGVSRAVKKFESLRDVGHIHPQTQLACALPKRPLGRMMCAQSRARETVHRFAQPDVAFAPELFSCRGHIVIEPDRRTHAINVASVMSCNQHHDAASVSVMPERSGDRVRGIGRYRQV